MSPDSSDKTTRLLANPLPIVMLVLLTAGVIVKNVPLESVRPADPERVKYMSTSTHQDVEARLWQDPFAAMEKHEKSFRDEKQEKCSLKEENKNCVPGGENKHPHTVGALHERINKDVKSSPFGPDDITVVAVSVFGGSFVEAAEWRRRSRFAVISALGFHNFYPENAEAIGYFETTSGGFGMESQKLLVPYEWYVRTDGMSNVLVLWLDEEKFTNMDEPHNDLKALFNKVAPPQCTANSSKRLNFKLVGPAGSHMLVKLMEKEKPVSNHGNSIYLGGGNTLQVFSPNATISVEAAEQRLDVWEIDHSSIKLGKITAPWIVRTIGTDKQLALALLWDLWQRGVNRKFGYDDSWWQQKWQQFVNNEKLASSMPKCKDGIVLISEQDSKYARTLSQNFNDHFSSLCETDSNVTKPPIRTFSYLRGLDGVLPDTDKSGTKASHKEDSKNQKDLGAQFSEVPKEHAEGRSQYNYLRRLTDEITQLDLNRDKQFAENGIKAIGIVGSDVYGKLLILQAFATVSRIRYFLPPTWMPATYMLISRTGRATWWSRPTLACRYVQNCRVKP